MNERTYGPPWARSREDATRCIESVHETGRGSHSYQCNRKRGFGKDGLYCKQHDPEAAAIKREANYAKYKRDLSMKCAPYKFTDLVRKMLKDGLDDKLKAKFQHVLDLVDGKVMEKD